MGNETMTYGRTSARKAPRVRLLPRVALAIVMLHGLCLMAAAQDRQKYDTFFLDAVCQREKGNNDAAFDLFSHCVELDSTRSEAYYYLAQYYYALKDRQKALDCAKKATELEPDNATYLETLANTYLTLHDYDNGATILERLYDKNHDRDDVLTILIQIYEQQGNYDKAIEALTQLELLEGKSERLSYAKSQFYTQKGDKKSAIGEMKQLADEYPNDPNYQCLYANALYTNGQQKKALALYQDILRQEPDNRLAQMAMLAHYKENNDTVLADKTLQDILLNKNTTQEDRVNLMRQVIAESEQQGGDSTRVLQLFRQMLAMPEGGSDMAMFCATYMNLKKMPNDSIRPILEHVLEVSPDHAAARLQLVSYAWQEQDRDRVIALCQEARQYTPGEMAFYYYQGIAYYQNEQLDQALDAFQNGISVINDESDPAIVSDFFAVMGDILHQKGREQEAFAAYDSCLQWKDDNIGCLNNYAYYLSELGQQLDKAEQMSYRTIKAEPKNATFLDTYAWILFMQKRYSEAKIYIDQTLQCDSDSSAVLLEHAGDIYYHTGDTGKALDLWQQALDRASEKSEIKDDRRQILIRKIKLKKYLKE